jgi:hypothetical protein
MIKTNEVTTVDFRLEILQKLYSAVKNKPTCCESACHLFFWKNRVDTFICLDQRKYP